MHTFLVTYYITPPGYIEQATFDLLWASVDYTLSNQRRLFYIQAYNLEPDVIINPDESETDIYRFTGDWWPALFGFFSTSDTSCPVPCGIATFPP